MVLYVFIEKKSRNSIQNHAVQWYRKYVLFFATDSFNEILVGDKYIK